MGGRGAIDGAQPNKPLLTMGKLKPNRASRANTVWSRRTVEGLTVEMPVVGLKVRTIGQLTSRFGRSRLVEAWWLQFVPEARFDVYMRRTDDDLGVLDDDDDDDGQL